MLYSGQEKGDRLEERVQLACQLKVKELNGFSVWNKRFCVLCGSRMFVFATSRPKGKPTLVLDLTGGNITAHRIKKHFYCLKVTASKKDILLSFDSRLEHSKWLQRAAKVRDANCYCYSWNGFVLATCIPRVYTFKCWTYPAAGIYLEMLGTHSVRSIFVYAYCKVYILTNVLWQVYLRRKATDSLIPL